MSESFLSQNLLDNLKGEKCKSSQNIEISNSDSKINLMRLPLDTLRSREIIKISFHVQVSSQIFLKVEAKISEGIANTSCIVARKNGTIVFLKSSLMINFIQKMNSLSPNIWYFSAGNHFSAIKFRAKIRINFQQILKNQQQDKIFLYLKVKIKKVLPSLLQNLQEFGIIPSRIKILLKHKKAELKAMKKIMKCFSQIPVQKSDQIQEKQSIYNQLSIYFDQNQTMEDMLDWQKSYEQSSFFKIYKKSCKFQPLNPQITEKQQKIFAIKCPNTTNKLIQSIGIKKLKRQQQIIKKLSNNKYFPTYYKDTEKQNALFMQFISESLTFYIYNNICGINTYLKIFLQIVEGIKTMNACGIVHRDLKPDNILIKAQCREYVSKIIDFGDSMVIGKRVSQQEESSFHETLPYSAFQCCLSSIQPNTSADIWSAGVILYEIIFKHSIPIYSHFFENQTLQGLANKQFDLNLNYTKKRGLLFVQYLVQILISQIIKIQQEKRINIFQFQQSIKAIMQYLDTFLQ